MSDSCIPGKSDAKQSFPVFKNDVLAKEEAKAQAMRFRFEERTKRFLDAKQRTIGVDKAYLQKQVEEKNKEMLKMKEEGKADGKKIVVDLTTCSFFIQCS